VQIEGSQLGQDPHVGWNGSGQLIACIQKRSWAKLLVAWFRTKNFSLIGKAIEGNRTTLTLQL
jgi:hypothetical protein